MYNNEKNNYNWEVKIMKSAKKVREKNNIFGRLIFQYFVHMFVKNHAINACHYHSNFRNLGHSLEHDIFCLFCLEEF